MKKLILLLVLSIIIFNNCSRANNDIPQLTLNGETFIKVIAENSFDSLILKTTYCSHFPSQTCLRHQIIIKKKGTYFASYRITRPDFVEIAIQDTSFYIYVIPTDTAVIKVGTVKNIKGEPSIYHEIDDPINR